MAGTSIPAFTDALLAMLNAATWPGVRPQILDGETSEPDRECIVVGDTSGSDSRAWSTIGGQRSSEQYGVTLVIRATTPGQTPKQARDRAFALWTTIDDAIKAAVAAHDTTLLITGFSSNADSAVLDVQLEKAGHTNFYVDEGCVCLIATAVTVQAET